MPTLGQIYYHGVHRPSIFLLRLFAYDGFVQGHINQWQAAKMREAAVSLHFPVPERGASYTAHYLTGLSHWHLSVFAAASLVIQTQGKVQPVFHSDGTIDHQLEVKLRRIFPGAQIVLNSEQMALIEHHAPKTKFPILNKMWMEFPMFRKLFGVHLWREGWSLYLDSDIMFWRKPDFLLNWLQAPSKPICMRDVQDSYGHDRSVLGKIAGFSVPTKINAGLVGLHSNMIDPGRLEYFATELLKIGGYNHFLEQAMTAMLLAQSSFEFVPHQEYFIPAKNTECSTSQFVCQHYTPVTRGWMYRHGWKKVFQLVEKMAKKN